MKKFYAVIFLVLISYVSQSQIIDFPDNNFKNQLVNLQVVDTDNDNNGDSDVDLNNDGEISIEEAEAVSSLIFSFSSNPISDVTGIEYFINLERLDLRSNHNLGSVNLSSNINLKFIQLSNCNLASLNITQLSNLESLLIFQNPISVLDTSDNTSLITLNISSTDISILDLSNNVNLEILVATQVGLTDIDLVNNVDLKILTLRDALFTEIDLTNNILLEELTLQYIQISNLDLSQNALLNRLNLTGNQQISGYDFSTLPSLEILSLDDTENVIEVDLTNSTVYALDISSSNVERVFMKNGIIMENPFYLLTDNAYNLEYICGDEAELETIQQAFEDFGTPGIDVTLNSYCSFVPGGEFYTVEGTSQLDINTDGCDDSDISFPNLNFNITDGSNDGTVISNSSGNYFIPLQEGTYTITPTLENPTYFMVSPSTVDVDFPTDGSPLIQDFCITPNGTFNDLEVTVIPLEDARPGFDVNYQISYKNKGTTVLSGSVAIQFDDNYMNFISANPAADNSASGSLVWDFTDLEPFETREITYVVNLNTPTDENFPLNSDDVLEFTAEMQISETDETPEDNTFILSQVVVNSFDPNDKRCLEGETITPEMIGRYVHYMIRFENTGTANAINVVVRDEIDTSKFDITTLVPLSSSHEFVTRIQNTNEVEFIFENIDLPFDDANNDGFVVFKIKTLESLTLGDTFSNDAEIYFDFNAPIITNDFVTSVEESLSIDDIEFNSKVTFFPNPVTDMLYISSETVIDSVSIYDIHGRLLQTAIFDGNETQSAIDLEQLSQGTYFITLTSKTGGITEKIIKN